MLNELKETASNIGIELSFDGDSVDYICKKSFDKIYGARPLRRTIMNLIENPLSKMILDSKISKGNSVKIILENGELKFSSL